MNVKQKILEGFVNIFSEKPALLVRAPGRVNLIGEHTDYNEGFVLPMAIDRAAWIALRPRSDRCVVVHALGLGQALDFSLDELERRGDWADYITGISWALQQRGYALRGWEGALAGDVPIGAGLSSSAAVEMAVARAFAAVSGFAWQPKKMALIGQRAENDWVGVNSGLMDQMVSAAARAGHALFLDCRSLDYEHVSLPGDVSIVVMDTSTRRGLVESAYNERRAQCEAAARHFEVRALRDVSPAEFAPRSAGLETTVMKRARHVVGENQRVLDALSALRSGDLKRLGELFDESHASLRDDFEVTNKALNQMVAAARSHPACFGARMTGAGFGGCALALVKRKQVEAFVEATREAYRVASGLQSELFVCSADQGAGLVPVRP